MLITKITSTVTVIVFLVIFAMIPLLWSQFHGNLSIVTWHSFLPANNCSRDESLPYALYYSTAPNDIFTKSQLNSNLAVRPQSQSQLCGMVICFDCDSVSHVEYMVSKRHESRLQVFCSFCCSLSLCVSWWSPSSETSMTMNFTFLWQFAKVLSVNINLESLLDTMTYQDVRRGYMLIYQVLYWWWLVSSVLIQSRYVLYWWQYLFRPSWLPTRRWTW